jgi:hypothetical protein
MRKFINWFKRFKSDAAIISATEAGALALAVEAARINAARAKAQRIQDLLDQANAEIDQAVADQIPGAERVAEVVETAIDATKAEFAEEEADYALDVNEINRQYVAENEELTKKYLADKAANLKKRDAEVSKRAAEFNARETVVMGEVLDASKVLAAAYEVILAPELPKSS